MATKDEEIRDMIGQGSKPKGDQTTNAGTTFTDQRTTNFLPADNRKPPVLSGGGPPIGQDGNSLSPSSQTTNKQEQAFNPTAQLNQMDKAIADRQAQKAADNRNQLLEDSGGATPPTTSGVRPSNQTLQGATSLPPTTGDPTAQPTAQPAGDVTTTAQYQAVRDQLQTNLDNPQLPESAKQTFTPIEELAGEIVDPNAFQVGDVQEGTAAEQQEVAEAQAGQAATQGYTASKANMDNLQAAMQAQIANQGQADPALVAQFNAAQAEFNTIAAASKGHVTKLVEAANATASQAQVVNAEAAYQDLNKVDPKTLAKALTHEVPNEATVQGQLDGLLSGLETGDVPLWAQPAVAAAEAAMASRGMSTSSVGRNALFNSIISSAMPIAQADAAAKLSVFQQDISNEQQAILSNSQFFQSLTMKNLDNRQQAAIVNATNATNVNVANAQNQTQASIANAQMQTQASVENAKNFLTMDLANMNNEQQANVLNGQMRQQTMLSNQAATNTALQFNAANQQQASQFNTNLAASIDQFNTQQSNAMSQYNSSEVNKNTQLNAQLQQQLELANQAAQNQAAQFGAGAANQASLQNAQLETQVALANSAAYNSMSQFNAQQQSAMSQFNANLGFQKDQFNVQNATAIEQSNANWRRQMNQTNTAGINAVNQANAMNQFNLSNQALTFLWQEQRDGAKWANDNAQNDEERKTRLAIAALSNESMQDAQTLNNIKALAGSVISIFDNWK